MKKLLILSLFLYSWQLIAQTKVTNVDELMINKTFTFIVSKVTQKPFERNDDSAYKPVPENVNAAAVSMQDRQKVNSLPVVGNGEYNQLIHDQLDRIDDSYTPDIIDEKNKTALKTGAVAIYLVQDKEKLSISGTANPSSVNKIKASDLYAVNAENYKLMSVKKSNGKWVLTYQVNEPGNKQTFYVDVAPNGSAVLTLGSTTVLSGFIVNSTKSRS